ncbi:MAG: indolepyruvate ferredoxin oxidoreductase subunit alpha [Thermoplasmata archaeon HGW-Thermoplasmata-1]|nr:MAG: indolepyruvate ferredoxin oxidoreductase subunit alpha [Thermoplasmata archaeon HGW-Thermoplasmata-1]
MDVTLDKTGEKVLLLGNEAIVRGALEAGIGIATTYPGTPSSEIADTFSKIAKLAKAEGRDPGYYMEYSTNEKVALEVAAAGAAVGVRALTCMKHVGLNVAADTFMTYAYVGTNGGHIIVSADDPGCHSSQNEQDNRYYALFGMIPMLEPATPEEAKEMTRLGMELSETLKSPLLLRTTTRLNHVRGPVKLGHIIRGKTKGVFEKDPMLVTVPSVARVRHPQLLAKMEKAADIGETSPFNFVETFGDGCKAGIVTSGVSYNYVREAVADLGLSCRILKLGMTNPLPPKLCADFICSVDTLVVVEEGEPFLENQFKEMAKDLNRCDVKILGKGAGSMSRLYEYTPSIVTETLAGIFGKENPYHSENTVELKMPSRPPTLCAGCPHRATYYAAKLAAPKGTIYPTDIGCYTLGRAKPLEMADYLLCMGSNGGTACGFSKTTDQKVISFMGDSTFFHSGIPPMVNAVHHSHDVTMTVLDNRTTAMTGHQPHPGSEVDGMGNPAVAIAVEEVARGCGVKHVEVVDSRDIKGAREAFKRALDYKGPSVIVSKSPCILLEIRDKRRAGEPIIPYVVDQEKCRKCGVCIAKFGCPAFYYDEVGDVCINKTMCNSCGVCASICAFGAISPEEQKPAKEVKE